MNRRSLPIFLVTLVLLVSPSLFAQQKSVLFDAGHAQTAGNADWTLDEDSCGIAQRYPTPDQAGITSSTAETFWSGGHSAMGVDLVKKGFHVESLPTGARITYNDATNAQDLKNYNVFVVPEPNVRFTAAEVTAIRSFVQNGGGLLMIADHAGADRNSDGWEPPEIFNDLMGSPSIFGITYNAVSTDKTGGWFDDHPDANYTNDTTSPIVWTGAYGVPSSTKGLGLFGSTSMTISGAAKAHIWKSTAAKGSTTLVTFATSTYGTGRVAGVGDSSITEDATNGCGHTTYLGYNDPAWDNGLLIANAVAWLANGTTGGGGGTDTTAPTTSITAPTAGSTVSGSAVTINANASDNVGVAKVEFWVDGTLKGTDTTSPYSYSWNTTTYANGTHTLVSKAYDAANNMGQSANVSVTVSNTTGSQQLIVNPGFETGTASPWTASAGIIDNGTGEAAHSGSWKAWLNGYGATHTDSLLQTVTIPSTATSATLSFWLHIDTAETGTTAFDTLKVQIRNSSGTVLATLATYSNANAAAGFAQKSFSVLTYKGQTVQVYLVGAEDTTLQTSFVVDDFALNVQ
ncbi:MAG: Hydrolase [Acidobacteria bacterium]|nr:Hydrolase [Acidobacteriota bacterium]